MNTGVSTTPWARVRRPRRAAPEVPRRSNCMVAPEDEHGVAIAEESVAVCKRARIGGADGGYAAEGRHQHEQRRLRQMEIGDEQIDDAEREAGGDEQVRVAAAG